MSYDDIIIGSGLSALAVALGLRATGRRILVLAGNDNGLRHYPDTNIPAARSGRGGMGEYWHGVIPTSLMHRPDGFEPKYWRQLADYFYPRAKLDALMGKERYFVPRKPIRPAAHFARLQAEGEVTIADIAVEHIESAQSSASVNKVVCGVQIFHARRIWLCAGALDTPAILARSDLIAKGVRAVSDHVIGYAGILARNADSEAMMAEVSRHGEGVFFPFRFGGNSDHFYTLRPARFDFAELDAGIAKRAVFGLPTSRVLSGLAGNLSPGLVAEALFNKFGAFARAPKYSVYFQTTARDSYNIDSNGNISRNLEHSTSDTLGTAQQQCPFAGIEATRQQALYIPGIHLHGSLTRDECGRFGPGKQFGTIYVVDASALRDIGPEHHSFAMMAAAYGRAIAVSSQD